VTKIVAQPAAKVAAKLPDKPSTQPIAQTAPPPVPAAAAPPAPAAASSIDCSTPLALMNSYDHLAGEDPPAYLSLYYLTDEDEIQRLAHVQAKFDAQVGMLQKIVQDKWGNDAVDQTLHALGLKSRRDIDAATLKQIGRHTKVFYADGTPGPELIRVKRDWRVDLPALRDSLGMPVDDYLKQLHQLSNILPDLADGIVNGDLKDADAVMSDIAKRINR
jgi:hypothetical protein